MKKLSILFIILFALLIVGCSEEEENNPVTANNPSLTGKWTGTGDNLTAEVDLVQSGTSITGTGTLQGTISCTVTGTNNYPSVDLKFFVNNVQHTVFSGSFSDDNTVSGKYTNSGFSSYDLKFVRY